MMKTNVKLSNKLENTNMILFPVEKFYRKKMKFLHEHIINFIVQNFK